MEKRIAELEERVRTLELLVYKPKRARESVAPVEKDPDALTPEDLVEAWNSVAAKENLATVRELSPSRRSKARARLAEHPKAEFWTDLFAEMRKSKFLLGRRHERGESSPWKATFDWLVSNDTNVLRVIEGRYSS